MSAFDWSSARSTLEGFGGKSAIRYVPKTGLPFYDTLRLYGAIDLCFGLREDVEIHDKGTRWEISGFVREHRLLGRAERAATSLKRAALTKKDKTWLSKLEAGLDGSQAWPAQPLRNATHTPLAFTDSALQNGVRDQAASKYLGLESGRGEEAKIPWGDATLLYSGERRTEVIANVRFIPVFEGRIDLSKVVSPLRAWVQTPNVLCAQALMLLALRVSLFAEGYQNRLTSVVYNTTFPPQKAFNYSGIIEIDSTAVRKMKSGKQAAHTNQVFRRLVSRAWNAMGQSTEFTPDALIMAYWLMQPVPKHLSGMITSQERLRRERLPTIFDNTRPHYIKEVFDMSYGEWQGNHPAVRKFAKAVASGIYYSRQKGTDDPGKAWYDEITMLRSASSAKTFVERAMILIEQGHREHHQVGTVNRDEDHDPAALMASIGQSQHEFETFRDLFRMYLVQESKPYKAENGQPAASGQPEITAEQSTEEGEEQ